VISPTENRLFTLDLSVNVPAPEKIAKRTVPLKFAQQSIRHDGIRFAV